MYLWLLGYCTARCGTALARQLFRGSPFPAGPHHASRARRRKEATDGPLLLGEGACYRHCHCAASHGTVPLEQLVSRRRAAKLLRLCPPLLSFQWWPAHQHTSTPKYSAACNLCCSGRSSNLEICPVGERHGLEGASGWCRESAMRTHRCWGTGGTRNTCSRYSLLADSLPRWYLPEELGRGAMQSGKEGGRGGWREATLVPASQPAQRPVPSAQCPVPRASASANAIRAFLFLCSRFI